MRRWIPRRALNLAACLATLAGVGCDDAGDAARLDLDAPQGRATAPGPWRVLVFGSAAPQVFARVDDGTFEPVALGRVGDGWAGRLPDAPVGSTVGYYARAGAVQVPATGEAAPRTFVVQPATAAPVAPPAPCQLAFRWPIDGLQITDLADGAPQVGVQLVVVVSTNLADGAAARLGVQVDGAEVASYSGVAGAGVVAFDAVTVPAGESALIAEATVPGADACAAQIRVSR